MSIIKPTAGEEILRLLTLLPRVQEDMQRLGLGVYFYGQLEMQGMESE